MDGGGEVNTGGWLPPPRAFGSVCVCVCVCVCVHKQKRINNDWTLHGKLGHHTFIRYLGPTNLVIPYLHQWYELWFCLRHVWFWVWLSRCEGKTARRA